MAHALDNNVNTTDAQTHQLGTGGSEARPSFDSVYNSPVGNPAALDLMRGAGGAPSLNDQTNGLILMDKDKVLAGGPSGAQARDSLSAEPKDQQTTPPAADNWFERQKANISGAVSDISGAVKSDLDGIGNNVSQTAKDIVQGKATLLEVGFAVGETGALVAAGAGAVAAATAAGFIEVPAAGAVALGAAIVAVAGEATMVYDSLRGN
jgi:hypothetical protein